MNDTQPLPNEGHLPTSTIADYSYSVHLKSLKSNQSRTMYWYRTMMMMELHHDLAYTSTCYGPFAADADGYHGRKTVNEGWTLAVQSSDEVLLTRSRVFI